MQLDKLAVYTTKNDTEQIKTVIDYLHEIEQRGKEGYQARLAFVRALAELARENKTARNIIMNALELIQRRQRSEVVAAFRATYLEGERRPSTRQLKRLFHVDIRTIYRWNKQVLATMLVLFFGVDGISFKHVEMENVQ